MNLEMIKEIQFTQVPANETAGEENNSPNDKRIWCFIRFTKTDERILTAIGEGSRIITALGSALADMQFLQEIY